MPRLEVLRLGIPSQFYFDEVHYVPAARVLREFSHITNQEHPLVGKEFLITIGDHLLHQGDIGAQIGADRCLTQFDTTGSSAALSGGIRLPEPLVPLIQKAVAGA